MQLAFDRPWALALLALPLALLVLRTLASRPERELSGTIPIWRRLASRAPASRAGGGLPPALVLGALALALAAVALAGPRPARARSPRTWRCVLDRSPALYLPWSAAGESPAPDAPTRQALALAAAQAWLARERADGDVVEWSATVGGAPAIAHGDAPPREWLAPPAAPEQRPDWPAEDRAGVLWITDRAPQARALAGVFASGGGAVPGPVAESARELWVWDGTSLAARPAPARELALDPALPAPVREIAALWAASRGLAVAGARSERTVLALEAAAGAGEPVRVGRDGWSASAKASALAPLAGGASERAWLSAGDPARALVAWSPGRVRAGLAELGEPAGDPAAFAVSWSELLDSARVPFASVVPLAERADAGAPVAIAPAAPATLDAASAEGAPESAGGRGLAVALAVLAAAAAIGARALLGSPRRSTIPR